MEPQLSLDDVLTVRSVEPPTLITIQAAADHLGLSRSKLYELIADGEMPTVKIGRARRIALQDLRDFVASRRAGS